MDAAAESFRPDVNACLSFWDFCRNCGEDSARALGQPYFAFRQPIKASFIDQSCARESAAAECLVPCKSGCSFISPFKRWSTFYAVEASINAIN